MRHQKGQHRISRIHPDNIATECRRYSQYQLYMTIKKRIFRTIVFTPFIVLGLALIVLSIKYSPTYIYRLITMNLADVYDYKNFENHKIREAKSTNKFISQPKEKYVESLPGVETNLVQTGKTVNEKKMYILIC